MTSLTGKYIQINQNDATNTLLHQLKKYDDDLENNRVPSINPYQDNVIMSLKNGKQAIIPEEIQRSAIAHHIHIKKKYDNDEDDNKDNIDDDEIDDGDDAEKIETYGVTSSLLNILMCLIIICVIIQMIVAIRYRSV